MFPSIRVVCLARVLPQNRIVFFWERERKRLAVEAINIPSKPCNSSLSHDFDKPDDQFQTKTYTRGEYILHSFAFCSSRRFFVFDTHNGGNYIFFLPPAQLQMLSGSVHLVLSPAKLPDSVPLTVLSLFLLLNTKKKCCFKLLLKCRKCRRPKNSKMPRKKINPIFKILDPPELT